MSVLLSKVPLIILLCWCSLASTQKMDEMEVSLLLKNLFRKFNDLEGKLDNLQTMMTAMEDRLNEAANSTYIDIIEGVKESSDNQMSSLEKLLELAQESSNEKFAMLDNKLHSVNESSENRMSSLERMLDSEVRNVLSKMESETNRVYEVAALDKLCPDPFYYLPDFGCVAPIDALGMNYQKAKETCKGLKGSRLLEGISSQGQLDLLQRIFKSYLGPYGIYLGITRWNWTEGGQPVPTSLWHDGEATGGDKECGVLDLVSQRPHMADKPCSSYYNALCQLKW